MGEDDKKLLEEEKLMEKDNNVADSTDPIGQEPKSEENIQVNEEMDPPVVPPTTNEKDSTVSSGDSEIEDVAKAFADNKDGSKGPNKSYKKLFMIIGVIMVVLFVFAGISTVAVLAAYDKITLPSSALQEKVSQIVKSIPFMPKTKEDVIKMAIEKHKGLKIVSFDISGSTDDTSIAKLTGLNNFDLNAKGKLDLTDTKTPKGEVSLVLGNNLDANFMLNNYFLYFKINKIPPQLSLMAKMYGFDLDAIKGIWVYSDGTPVESESRDLLNETKDENMVEQKSVIGEFLKGLLDEDIISKIKMTQDNDMYVLTLNMNHDELNQIQKKYYEESFSSNNVDLPADYKFPETPFKNLKMTVLIGKDDHYIHKITSTSVVSVPDNALSSFVVPGLQKPDDVNKDINIALAVNLSNFNEKFDLNVPTDAKSFETIVSQFIPEGTPSMMPMESTPSTKTSEPEFSGFE